MKACANTCGRAVTRQGRFAVLCLHCLSEVADQFERRRGRACSPFQGQVGPMLGELEQRGLVTISGLTVTPNPEVKR